MKESIGRRENREQKNGSPPTGLASEASRTKALVVVPKVWGAPPWGGARKRSLREAQEVCGEKKLNGICIQQIFSELYLPYIFITR
jgi:hypothetical protein